VRYNKKPLQRVNSINNITALFNVDATYIELIRKRIKSISLIEVYRNSKEFIGIWIDLNIKGEN
jgi:hypothetical protein